MKPKKRIRRWFDRHHHLRLLAKMLGITVPALLRQMATGAIIMGNLGAGFETSSIERTVNYNRLLKGYLPAGSNFQFKMTLYITEEITPDEVEKGFRDGIWCAGKLYLVDPKGHGGTSHSASGVRDIRKIFPVLERMQKIGMPLLGHFEDPCENTDEFDREVYSLDKHVLLITKEFPALIIVIEHISDKRMAEFVIEHDGPVFATVTPQHLCLSRNALFKGGLNPAAWCKPVLKRDVHQQFIRRAVTSHDKKIRQKFGAGSDSAPWDKEYKSKPCGCNAGIFSPYALEIYTTVFDEEGASDEALEDFLSVNFLHIYGMEVSNEYMELENEPTIIQPNFGDVVVFRYIEPTWRLVA